MTQKDVTQSKKHALSLTARERASITGVMQVDSFDERCVTLKTDCGEMIVEGEELHVGVLDIARGEIEITGRICAVCYSDAAPAKRGFRARLFG
jgi:sporulation protein YabP